MKRYSIVPLIGTGTIDDPRRADTSACAVSGCIILAQNATHALIKQNVPDGIAELNNASAVTISDLLSDNSDFLSTNVPAARVTAITAWLTARYPAKATAFTNAVAAAGGTITRKQLALWMIQTLLNRADITAAQGVTGFDLF